MLQIVLLQLLTSSPSSDPPPSPSPPPYHPSNLLVNYVGVSGAEPIIQGVQVKIAGEDTLSPILSLLPSTLPPLEVSVEVTRPSKSKSILAWVTVMNNRTTDLNYALGMTNIILPVGVPGVEEICAADGYRVLGDLYNTAATSGSEIYSELRSSTTYPLFSFSYGNNRVGRYSAQELLFMQLTEKDQYTALAPPLAPAGEHTWLFILGYGSVEEDSNDPRLACDVAQKFQDPSHWPAEFLQGVPASVQERLVNWNIDGTSPEPPKPPLAEPATSEPTMTPMYLTVILACGSLGIFLAVVWLVYRDCLRQREVRA